VTGYAEDHFKRGQQDIRPQSEVNGKKAAAFAVRYLHIIILYYFLELKSMHKNLHDRSKLGGKNVAFSSPQPRIPSIF
jgi:hypothetical protein